MKQSVAANMFRGSEGVGGRLHFEETQMIFKSHKFNIQAGDTAMIYSDIVDVQKRRTWGLIPNGMLVKMKNGTEYQFVVWNRNKIIQFLKEKIN